jgi:hypothetical protein
VRVTKILIPTAIVFATAPAAAVAASAGPALQTGQACYLVGQRVAVIGAGFAPSRKYQVAVDGINFGLSTTDATGSFTASLIPGGLGANVVQEVHILSATDGTSETRAPFTVTRTTGARILAGTGSAATLRAPFQLWGFELEGLQPPLYTPTGTRLPVYVHYLSPQKRLKTTEKLGHTGGQCGYLRTKPKRVFPFTPSRGTWTLQVDTNPVYMKHAPGPKAKIILAVS